MGAEVVPGSLPPVVDFPDPVQAVRGVALYLWGVASAHPPLAILAVFAAMAYWAWKCFADPLGASRAR